jgi:hypothetical protein
MTTKKRFTPKQSHYITLDEAVAQPTLSLYGKLVKDGESQPSAIGISHPSDPAGALHRSLVFGFANGIQCQSLSKPQQVWLPTPDGPADGCGWDPAEYVVWKNLPPDWMTLHIVAERKPLSHVLAAGRSPRIAALKTSTALETFAVSGVSDMQIIAVVKEWAGLQGNPDRSQPLGVLWANSGGSDWSVGAQYLSQLLQQRLNVSVSSSAITQSMTIDGLINLIG